MGVKDLLKWVRTNHPEAITSYPSRWATPMFKGKKVAIDATLLTNRYHFASRDGPFKGKGEVIGWYNLISEMRAHGVKPIAIWDQRGVRDWKASEARRRLTVRAGHLARRNHEVERSSRLHHLREVLYDFEALPKEEQELVKAHYEITRFMFLRPKEATIADWEDESPALPLLEDTDGQIPCPLDEELPPHAEASKVPIPAPQPPSPENTVGGPSKSEQLSATLTEADDQVIERVTSMIDALAPLVQEYRDSLRPSSQSTGAETDEMGLGLGLDLTLDDEVVQMEEELREEWPTKPTLGERRKMQDLDETLADLVPAERVTETPRQKVLTKEEGEIINDILSPTLSPITELPSDSESEGAEGVATQPSTDVVSPLKGIRDPMERLDTLIDSLPTVRGIYERALDIPSAADHEDCKELLRAMGVPVLEAKIPYEAEGLASALAKRGLVDYVGSEDSDVLAYEAPFLRHLSPATSPLTLISGEELRERTALPREQWLDFLILLGTDASYRIPKVGPVTALQLIKAHGSIEGILENAKVAERVDREGFMELVNNARKVFTQLPPTDHLSAERISGTGAEEAAAEGNVETDRDKVEGHNSDQALELDVDVEGLEERPWDEEEVERLLEEKHGIRLVESEYTFESA